MIQEPGKMHKLEMLEVVAEKIKNCTRCPELVEDRLLTVPGHGNANASLVLIGESPGQTESETGKPFVGKAGILLTNILAACGINREDIFICNTIKCRPPKNRKPTEKEICNCFGYLELQLKIIKPKYILCLGGVAANALLGNNTPISYLRNEVFDYKGAKTVATFHPSYALRGTPEEMKDRKQAMFNDIQFLLSENLKPLLVTNCNIIGKKFREDLSEDAKLYFWQGIYYTQEELNERNKTGKPSSTDVGTIP